MHNPQIWIVEDDADDIDFLKEAFDHFSSSITVRYFQSGDQMLSLIRQDNRPAPLLLLIDWQMPFMNGWELISRLRREHSSLPLKIKLLSGGITAIEQSFALNEGIPLYEKPVSVAGWQTLACYMITELTNYRSYFPHTIMQRSLSWPNTSRHQTLF